MNMSKAALYFKDSLDKHYDRAYIDGNDISNELCGYFFDVVINNGELEINESGLINVDHEDILFMLKENDDKPTLKQPVKKQYNKALELAKKIGPRADGFVIRKSISLNRMFSSVNIVYDKIKE
jgi:hypothetical protein